MRKLLSVILVLAMVLGLVGTAFAATPTDVAGTDFQSAVTRLAALEILGGYPDGTFKPNNNITRAEVAKIMVNSLGLGSAANSAMGATKFKDVPATHWASGYINLAVSRGIITGYPDGTFAPEANVSNAEALAMLVRVLGYQPAVTGDWPMNYVSKASQLGLTDGMTILPGVPAIRGNVALMTDNALEIPLMVQENFGTLTSYKADPNTNLLKTYLSVTELKDKVVTASPLFDRVNLKADQIKLDGVIYKIGTAVDADSLIGHTVDAWSRNGVIFSLNDKTSTTSIVTGTYYDYDAAHKQVRLQDANGDPTIKYRVQLDTNSNLDVDGSYVNHESIDFNGGDAIGANAAVTLVLNDEGKVSFITGTIFDDLGSTATSALVTKITNTEDEQSITYNRIGSVATTNTLDLTDMVYTIVDANGAKMTLSDVQKNDIVSIGTTSGNYWIRIVRNAVSGDVTKVTTTNDTLTSSYRVYIGTTAYKIATGAQYMTLVNGVKTVTTLDRTTADNLVGGTVKAYLDAAGKLRFVDMTKEDAANFGVLYKDTWVVPSSSGDSSYITILKYDGTKESLLISDDATGDLVALDNAANVGNLVKYTVDKNGALLTAVVTGNAQWDNLTGTTRHAAANITPDADGYDRFQIGGAGAWYYVNPNTQYFYLNTTTGKYAVTTWDSVSGIAGGNTTDFYTSSTYANRVDYVIVKAVAPATTSTAKVAFLSKYRDADSVQHFVVDEKGVEKDYKVSSTVAIRNAADTANSTFAYRSLGTLEFNASGVVTKVLVADPVVEARIAANKIDSAAKAIYVGTTAYYATSSTMFYDMRTSTMASASFDELAEGMQLRIFTNADGFVTYVVMVPVFEDPTATEVITSIAGATLATGSITCDSTEVYTTTATTKIYNEATGALVDLGDTAFSTPILVADQHIQVWADSSNVATRIIILP